MIVEERDYRVKHGKLAEFIKLYSEHGLPIQKELLGKFLGYFTTDIGELNHVVAWWQYDSLADREARREAHDGRPALEGLPQDDRGHARRAELAHLEAHRLLAPTLIPLMVSTKVRLRDGAELSVHVDGDGQDLLLVTGLGGTAAFWEPVVAPLAKRFRVIRFDQRGIAESTRGTAPVDIDRLAEDAFAVLDHVGSANALLLGHSTGGVILKTMALMQPARIAGLVLSGSWIKPNRYMSELFRSRLAILRIAPREYAAMVAFLGHPADWLEANWPYYEAMLAGAPITPEQQDVVAERIAAILKFDRSGEIGQIKLPTLIQGAEDDLIVPAFLQREQARALPAADFYMFRTGGHFFPVTRVEEFVAVLTRFADGISSPLPLAGEG
jgi:aminoacrylate hydrolase